MRVAVKWLKSPRHVYGIPRQPGSHSLLKKEFVDEILEADPEFLEVLEKEKPVKVKDTVAKKPRIRPVERGQKES